MCEWVEAKNYSFNSHLARGQPGDPWGLETNTFSTPHTLPWSLKTGLYFSLHWFILKRWISDYVIMDLHFLLNVFTQIENAGLNHYDPSYSTFNVALVAKLS